MKILDIYRTAPYGENLLAIAITAGVVNFKDLPSIILPCTLLGLSGAIAAGHQFMLRARLKSAIKYYGYKDELFYPTITEWCNRQTARVVARESGHLDDYIKLCERNKGIQEFKSLPHF